MKTLPAKSNEFGQVLLPYIGVTDASCVQKIQIDLEPPNLAKVTVTFFLPVAVLEKLQGQSDA